MHVKKKNEQRLKTFHSFHFQCFERHRGLSSLLNFIDYLFQTRFNSRSLRFGMSRGCHLETVTRFNGMSTHRKRGKDDLGIHSLHGIFNQNTFLYAIFNSCSIARISRSSNASFCKFVSIFLQAFITVVWSRLLKSSPRRT